MDWDPDLYLSFGEPRLRPALDLLARVPADHVRAVVDLGCGPGNITPYLAEKWPAADIVGVDSSPEMLGLAEAGGQPGVTWVLHDLTAWQPTSPPDVIFCNAALQWVPDHIGEMIRLGHLLAEGGCLAVQVPANHATPSHTQYDEMLASSRWRDLVGHVQRLEPVPAPAVYVDRLSEQGFGVEAWETTYVQPLTGEDPVARWLEGSLLRPALAALADRDRDEFRAEYAARMRACYRPDAEGTTVFEFRRVFIIARPRP